MVEVTKFRFVIHFFMKNIKNTQNPVKAQETMSGNDNNVI